MSKRWKKSLSLVVLVSFIALLAPKSLWHDCSHGAHAGTKHPSTDGKHQFSQGVEKCYACDLHIPLLSSPTESLTLVLSAPAIVEQLFVTTAPAVATHGTHFLRGPPAA